MGGEVDPVPLCDTASLEAPVWYHVISEDGTHLSLELGTDTQTDEPTCGFEFKLSSQV